jgi:hypothetical protein
MVHYGLTYSGSLTNLGSLPSLLRDMYTPSPFPLFSGGLLGNDLFPDFIPSNIGSLSMDFYEV